MKKEIFSAVTLLFLSFFLISPRLCTAYVPDVGPGECKANCGNDTPSGGDTGYTYYAPPVSTGPTPEQLRQQRLEQDAIDAALDANDDGYDAYQAGDYVKAIQFFSEALEYAPDDDDIAHNLERAREALQKAEETRRLEIERAERAAREAEAARQLKSAEAHSQAAEALRKEASSMEARKGFDTAGKDVGAIEIPASESVVDARNAGADAEPKVPLSKRTWAITKMELKREGAKLKVKQLEAKREKLDPEKDAVEIVEIKQEISKQENEIHYLNFSINEELEKAPEQKSDTPKPDEETKGKQK